MAENRLAPTPATPPAVTGVTAGGWLAGLEWALLAAALGFGALGARLPLALVASAWLLAGAWLARWRRAGHLTRATALDWPLLLLTLSVLAGLWAAPNTPAALARLVLFAGAISVYYTLANSAGAGLRRGALGVAVVGGVIAAAFLLGLTGDHLHRNDVAGVQAITTPVAIAVLLQSVRARRRSLPAQSALTALVAGTAVVLGLVTPVLAGSRTVGLAAAATLAMAGWWWLAARISRPRRGRQAAVFGLGLALVLAGTVGVLAWQPAWIAQLLRTLPGADPTTGLGRYVLFGQAWQLTQATPFTGGGLGAFPALYSTYIHDIPHFLLPHAHNNYLNVLVEQGWPGLAALVLALVSAGWVAARGLAEPPAENRALLAAGAAGLVMASVHGLGDASLVATWAAPFLLVPAGLVAATAPPPASARPWHRPWLPAALAACVLSLGALLTAGPRPLAAAWEANLGAVQQSRVWLRNWPTGEWYDGTQAQAEALAVAQQHYAAALEWDPRNVSAHFGLGLLARGGQDFETAALHLDQALALAPTHRGVIKVLGYTDVWLGRPNSAEPLLRQIPEAARELSVYVGWWGEQGRPDLADRAAQMQARLER